ncbi:MAG: hypothetical protein K0Q63_1746 [Paenibacillus sp.]|nr:hypothetical protein [Paenibacillus sp.]
MGKLRITERKRAWLTAMLAFLLPGMGHVYNGQYSRGLLLLSALLLDLTAIIRLANSDGGRHLLLIVYLGILLPIYYFVSVYEALQLNDTPAEEKAPVRLLHGILLAASGLVMMILIKPPEALLPWMNELAELIVGPLLMAIACLIVLTTVKKGDYTVFKLGRLTAAVLILTVGALLLWDQTRGSNDIVWLRDWWPLLFLLLGIEVILYSTVLRAKAAKLKLDLTGAAAALVVTVTAYAVTQYADFPVRWLDQFNVDLGGMVDYGEEKGYRVDKNVMKVLIDEQLSSISIKNVNGDVLVRSGDVNEIEVYSTVWVDAADEAESKKIAENSTVEATPGREVVLETKGQRYGADNKRVPKMNIEVVIPRIEPRSQKSDPEATQAPDGTDHADMTGNGTPANAESTSTSTREDEPVHALPDFDIDPSDPAIEPPTAIQMRIEAVNGAAQVEGVVAEDGLTVISGDGAIRISRFVGPLAVTGNNGSIEADSLTGASTLELKNGEISVSHTSGGSLYATTSNGNIRMADVADEAEAETKNGTITIDRAYGAVKASTMNGGIVVNSEVVGGNWDLDSSVGEIKVGLPEQGDYSLYGSVTFGKIHSTLPFEQIRKTIRGTVGAGTYRIHINATNSITIESRADR